MKNKIIELLDDWKVNKHKQELMANDLLILCGFNCSCADRERKAYKKGWEDGSSATADDISLRM